MYAKTVKLKAAKGKEDELGSFMRDTAAKVTQNEKDTIFYVACRNMKDPTEFLFYEQYKSKEYWEQVHMNMPYIKEAVEKLPTLIEGEWDITEYETIE